MLFEGWRLGRLHRRNKEIETPTPLADRNFIFYRNHLNHFFSVKILFLIYKQEWFCFADTSKLLQNIYFILEAEFFVILVSQGMIMNYWHQNSYTFVENNIFQ